MKKHLDAKARSGYTEHTSTNPKEHEVNTTQIQLNKLTVWAGNVRKTQSDAGIAELAASIQAHGLLQPVIVQAEKKGSYSVVAGRRRFMALALLAEKGEIPADYVVPAMVIPADADRSEVSLVENVMREPMHPADEFEAFKALVDAGQSITDVAARFGVSETVVKKRLTLADVSPVIMQAYRDEKIDLQKIMAFAVNNDHARQEKVFREMWKWDDARDIRRYLTEGEIRSTDRRVKYLTVEAYEQAGGSVRRDLFADEVYILDADLLDKLVAEKLEQDAEAVRAERWAWVEIIPNVSYQDTMGMQQVEPDLSPLTAEQQKEVDQLTAEYQAIEDSDDEITEEQSDRMDAIDERLNEIEETRTEVWSPDLLPHCGAIVAIGEIKRGLMKKDGKKSSSTSDMESSTETDAKTKDENALSASLIHDLTSHKSAALSAALAKRPDVALAATVYTLIGRAIDRVVDSPVKITVSHAVLSPAVSEKGVSKGCVELDKIGKVVKKGIPSGKKLWPWCLTQDTETLLNVLAYCVAQGVDTVAHHMSNASKGGDLAAALDFNMADWFTPTADNYFGRISKPQMLTAIEEMTVEPLSPSLEKMKKGDLAKHAEQVAKKAATPYVPLILRTGK
ncbi:ParB/RepB/Spo0J family partition protein [Spirosoma sp. KUDC1026]|uniref:ParB/RepB/Spo0J family partition protein n=1 Tax=Spirosoma sp. KUDC1026 TaxID=2745947 RepID=UPI00159BB9E3|nr:ParB/RepB/Spo0J family partition protein [Spirosoma sp. KUDC1026]QKZ15909.1 ParB/RepB/Spo0J family partition protein [Spirosoma sp. KUDC1026]